MREKYKKHPHNQYFLVRGLAFITKKSESLIIKEFGLRSCAILSFTGQQYFAYKKQEAAFLRERGFQKLFGIRGTYYLIAIL